MRSECFTEFPEIKKNLKRSDNNHRASGTTLYYKNGVGYNDDSERHIIVDGLTGIGKSACVSTTYAFNCLNAKECLVCVDPKGDLYERTSWRARQTHRVICIDLRFTRSSPDGWNPLLSPYLFYKSGDPDKIDIACEEIAEIAHDLYPDNNEHGDPFWPQSAANYFTGLVFGLFDTANPEEITIDSVAAMMEASERRSLIEAFASCLDDNSIARRHLASYTSAPSETRGSIHSVAANSLSIFARSRGLMELLGRDTININELDVDEKPLAIYIIVPDSETTYHPLAGLFISQLTKHFIRLAHSKYDGRLPVRINLILEELSSVGASLSNLPNLLVASRSRNIRIMLILQSGYSQLADLYGKSNAETIDSCCGVTIAFSTNNMENLRLLSQKCGEKQVDKESGRLEPLITPAQLAAMPVGVALVLIGGRFKFVAKLPFYNEVFDMSDWQKPVYPRASLDTSLHTFDMRKYVDKYREEKINDMMRKDPYHNHPSIPSVDIGRLCSAIDAKIAQMKMEEELSNNSVDTGSKYSVVISDYGRGKGQIVAAVRHSLGITFAETRNLLNSLPATIQVDTKEKAEFIMGAIAEVAGHAAIHDDNDEQD